MAKLPYFQVEAGAEQQRFEMPDREPEVVVGRATDCQWIIASGAVSRRHARLVRHGRAVTIEDLDSSNGTFVNGERLSAPRELHDQDRVRLGAVEILFVIPPDEPSADETIAVSDIPSLAPVKAPPIARPTETKATSQPPEQHRHAYRATAAPPCTRRGRDRSQASSARAPPRASSAAGATAAREPTTPPVPAAAPSAGRSEWPGSSQAADRSQPTIAELAIIAAGSFLVVFAIGALLIRFVF